MVCFAGKVDYCALLESFEFEGCMLCVVQCMFCFACCALLHVAICWMIVCCLTSLSGIVHLSEDVTKFWLRASNLIYSDIEK